MCHPADRRGSSPLISSAFLISVSGVWFLRGVCTHSISLQHWQRHVSYICTFLPFFVPDSYRWMSTQIFSSAKNSKNTQCRYSLIQLFYLYTYVHVLCPTLSTASVLHVKVQFILTHLIAGAVFGTSCIITYSSINTLFVFVKQNVNRFGFVFEGSASVPPTFTACVITWQLNVRNKATETRPKSQQTGQGAFQFPKKPALQ